MPSLPRSLTALLVAGAFTGALAATAGADSIVYVKDGNVWPTSPDAAKLYQVTFDGGYASPYWFGQYSQRYDYGCSCYVFHRESKTAWTYSDRFTDPTAESENYLGLERPEWLTNDRLLASYPSFWMSGWTFKLGTATGYSDKAAEWWYQFKDDEGYNFYPTDPALSPDGKKLALTNGADPNTKNQLLLASVPGPAWVGDPSYENDYLGNSAVEQAQLQCAQEKGVVVNPTWSQDSTRVAYGLGDGIHVVSVPADLNCGSRGAWAARRCAPAVIA
jgi:hypothetical protein